MELKWFEDFVSLARCLNFSRAASERNITQPALSRRIKQLEDWLGASLISRKTYPVQLTPEGQEFFAKATEIMSTLSELRSSMQQRHFHNADTLTFATLNTLSLTFFPHWIKSAGFATRTRFSEPKSSFLGNISSLFNGESDFLLTYAHDSIPSMKQLEGYAFLPLGQEKVIPVCAPDITGKPLHPLTTGQRPIEYLSYGDCSFFAHMLNHVFSRRPLPLKTIYENGMAAGLKAMTLSGSGVAWIPESLIRTELATGTLVCAGDRSWELLVDIRVYRPLVFRSRHAEQFWRKIVTQEQAVAELAAE
ncbi:LysR family transcriptional regulator [Phyllobacterium myrsinacearum]|uniref:DNA-binding transcriptional LysR family regulator n=1 Tax=Phyllobacterium myrsinacearum TaxID=28101 RepID=A0A839ESJ3_9HYPH|nr:LysR family transcriptional regulator [Phyllobacterium myrsinacearum]MBA8881075.1 DNA-binding transcriptional LysR family regulator [Phyllobacterium myrsinacearum]